MPNKPSRTKNGRHQIQWRRKKLPNGKYLLIAITKEAGPRGGHTVATVKQSQVPKTSKRRKVKVKRTVRR